MATDKELLELLKKPGAVDLFKKYLEKESNGHKVETKVKVSKLQVEVEHHYHCEFCGLTEIKVFLVDIINLRSQKAVHQDVLWCTNCIQHLSDPCNNFTKEQIVARAVRVIKKAHYVGGGK